MTMKISGDCPELNPQPFPYITRGKKHSPNAELHLNKTRLEEIKKQMKSMKEQINKFSEILKKEVGDEINIKELLKYGSSSGWQGRAQLILTLRLKLISMRSKFLDPPHKMYYRGPFDPKKEFDLKFLPQKQDNLYGRMLEEKKKKTLQLEKPISVLQKELDDLTLMYRAARFRTKSLVSKVKDARNELSKSKQKAEVDLRVIEGMMAHQSLFKMMIEPETFRLDPTLKHHIVFNPMKPPKIPEWSKFKMLYNKTQKEKLLHREVIISLTSKLDEINKKLIESKKLDIENRLYLEAQNCSEVTKKDKQQKVKDSGKEQTESENKRKILVQENRYLRQCLLNSILMAEEDFKIFISAIDASKEDFINALQNEEVNI